MFLFADLDSLPNIQDSHAVDAQTACPGYKAQHVTQSPYGFEADLKLAGKPCNVYGTDIEDLHLSVQYQAADRLSVNISPTFIVSSHTSPKASGIDEI